MQSVQELSIKAWERFDVVDVVMDTLAEQGLSPWEAEYNSDVVAEAIDDLLRANDFPGASVSPDTWTDLINVLVDKALDQIIP